MTDLSPRVPRRLLSCAVALAALVAPVFAEVPPPDYFTGLYERVGRDEAGKLIDDLVRLDPQGEGVALSLCPPSEATPPVALKFETIFEVENFLTGKLGEEELGCMFHNDSQNYPILNCGTEGGARFTLWPLGSGPGCAKP